MKCNFEEKVNHSDGSFTHAICVRKAEVFPEGLCYTCAYTKVKAENTRLKEAKEKYGQLEDILLILEDTVPLQYHIAVNAADIAKQALNPKEKQKINPDIGSKTT